LRALGIIPSAFGTSPKSDIENFLANKITHVGFGGGWVGVLNYPAEFFGVGFAISCLTV